MHKCENLRDFHASVISRVPICQTWSESIGVAKLGMTVAKCGMTVAKLGMAVAKLGIAVA